MSNIENVPPITIGYGLKPLFDQVAISPEKLAGLADDTNIELDPTWQIHCVDKSLWAPGVSPHRLQGQCVKIKPDADEQHLKDRIEYVNFLMPGLDEDKINSTTFVFLDMQSIMMNTFVVMERKDELPTMTGIYALKAYEKAVCKNAGRILFHELLHASIPGESYGAEEADERKVAEEKIVETKLAEADSLIPPRMVNARVSTQHNLASLKNHFGALLSGYSAASSQ